ncbi:MAG: holo-ACP synthase [Peptostreptococcaceae bacterium]|nr:holo-ACP synthase [Peptostreptococcaceae bacterium]
MGLGTDIIEIERIRGNMNERFLCRIFTAKERERIEDKSYRAAGIFAAKEAVSKALGTGICGFGWKDIEILKKENGEPYVSLHGKAEAIAKEQGIKKMEITISHCREYATAVASCR